MNRFEESQQWEKYARDHQDAWEKEYQRQTVAYQQLQVEMSKLMQLLLESQRNQSDFMTETAKLFDNSTNDYYELRKEVMAYINESRTSMSQIKGYDTATSRDTQAKFAEIINKLDQVISTLAQKSNPAGFIRESSQLFQPSTSIPSPSMQPAQEFSNTFIRESSQQFRHSSTLPDHESNLFKQESKRVIN